MTKPIRLLLLLPAALLVASCSSKSSTPTAAPSASHSAMPSMSSMPTPPAGSASNADLVATIKNFAYTVPASVPAGATLKVVNQDSQAHTFTIDAAHEVKVPANGSAFLVVPNKAGVYPVTCDFHPNMHSSLTVT